MQKLSVLIVDTETEDINLLKTYFAKHYKGMESIYTAHTVEEAKEQYLEYSPNILVLGTALQDGTTVFKFLESIPTTKSEIIFTSTHTHHAVEAINTVNTTAFLIKPIKPTDLIMAIDKAIHNIEIKNLYNKVIGSIDQDEYIDYIAIPSSDKIHILNPNDIIYIEADGRYTLFHLSNGSCKIASRNIGEYEKQLSPKKFFRIHHGYIVNLSMVTDINKSAGNYCEMINKKALPIAKRRQEKLHRFLKIK